MYEAYFNLKCKPFELLPDPDFLYMSPAHRKAISFLDYGIKERAGFILLTGEVGSGKTTIIKNIIKGLDTKITTSLVFTTSVTAQQLLALINDDFGLESGGKDKITLLKDLTDFLISQFVAGRHCLLTIDEAQNLSPECLEEVRMLSNLETECSKLLQIILVGQPELRNTLAANDMRQLRQRISINSHLPPLELAESEAYILHRLECAGNRNALIFSSECFEIIQQYTRGIPRLINIICDFMLLASYAESTNILTGAGVRAAAAELQFDRNYWNGAAEVGAPDSASGGGGRENELLELAAAHAGRLDTLEKSRALFVQRDEFSALAHRCWLLEEALQKLRRQPRYDDESPTVGSLPRSAPSADSLDSEVNDFPTPVLPSATVPVVPKKGLFSFFFR
jgi:general secretion pathway protein A